MHFEDGLSGVNFSDEGIADRQRDQSYDPKRAIDQAPVDGYAADGSGNKCQRKDEKTGEHPGFDDPFVFDRVAEGADEDQRYDEVCKGEPVIAIGQEGIIDIGVL